jgi:hypothetical protein
MKKKALVLALLLVGTIGLADPMKLEDLDKDQVVEQLEKSGTVFAAQLEAVRSYAKSYQYEETARVLHPFVHMNNVMPGIFTVDLMFGPVPAPQSGSYPVIRVTAYFTTPTHFERTIGKNDFKFYKFESTVDVITIGPRQPGDISSAGRK